MAKKQKQTSLESNLIKYLSAIITALTFWVFTTTNDTEKTLESLSTKFEILKTTVDTQNTKIEDFTSIRRFAKQDFDQNILPILTQLNKNTAELNIRNGFMDSTRENILKLQFRLETLEKK